MKKSKTGKIVITSGANVWPHELHTATALANAGYDVKFIPTNKTLSSADAYINNTIFEFKAPEGSSIGSIERNIRKAINHQSPNIVIDSHRIKKVQDRSIKNFLTERLRRGHGIKKLIFVDRNGNVLDINKLIK